MHSSVSDLDAVQRPGDGTVYVAIAALVTEGRTAAAKVLGTAAGVAAASSTGHGFSEGPHCIASKAAQGHVCSCNNALCIKYEKVRSYVLSLWQKSLPLSIDVLLVPKCCCDDNDVICNSSTNHQPIQSALLLEQWQINIIQKRTHDLSAALNLNQLITAIRSQLYFSQISAWLASPDASIRQSFQDKCSIVYCLSITGETYGCRRQFNVTAPQQHTFPVATVSGGTVAHVSLTSLPRTERIPPIPCSNCDVAASLAADTGPGAGGDCSSAAGSLDEVGDSGGGEPRKSVLDDRMQMLCTLKGKHRCDDFDELENCCGNAMALPSTSTAKTLLTEHGMHVAGCKFKFLTELSAESEGKCDINKVNDISKMDHLELSRKEFVEVLSVLKKTGPMMMNAMKPSSSTSTRKTDLEKQSKSDILLGAILRSSKVQQQQQHQDHPMTNCLQLEEAGNKRKQHKGGGGGGCESETIVVNEACGDNNSCDTKNDSIIISDNISRLALDSNCDNVKRKRTNYIINNNNNNKMCDISNVFSLEYLEKRQKVKVKQKITFDDQQQQQQQQQPAEDENQFCEKCNKCNNSNNTNNNNYNNNNIVVVVGGDGSVENNRNNIGSNGIPSALEQAKFRKSLDSAASMVFHSRTGLPLTSSPAPVRRGKSCFDFDSSINSVSAIRSALFSLASCSTDEDSESDCSIVSPCSPDATNGLKQREPLPVYYRHRGQSSGLLGSFVESVLNGRLEPVSTVHGFTAELGASGSFCPRHVVLPVTVFFYTLGDNDKVSTPYLGHINLGKKGYNVPKSGTIQVTLFNPLGTVVKMFVIMYDLSDMPPNSQTFIRQRTLFMPANCQDKDLEWSQKWLRYLVHLRFMSSKSGRIYLHSDIRMIICRKSDLDTATAHGIDMSYELRSFTNCPSNPRFSPRK